jgi:hypothetical protein
MVSENTYFKYSRIDWGGEANIFLATDATHPFFCVGENFINELMLTTRRKQYKTFFVFNFTCKYFYGLLWGNRPTSCL